MINGETPPKKGDYIQLLNENNEPGENFLLVDKWIFWLGAQLWAVDAEDGQDLTITRHYDLDTDERRAWQEVITATPGLVS